eukprot:4427921-Prymnesium_polylepis.1
MQAKEGIRGPPRQGKGPSFPMSSIARPHQTHCTNADPGEAELRSGEPCQRGMLLWTIKWEREVCVGCRLAIRSL